MVLTRTGVDALEDMTYFRNRCLIPRVFFCYWFWQYLKPPSRPIEKMQETTTTRLRRDCYISKCYTKIIRHVTKYVLFCITLFRPFIGELYGRPLRVQALTKDIQWKDFYANRHGHNRVYDAWRVLSCISLLPIQDTKSHSPPIVQLPTTWQWLLSMPVSS